MNKKFVFTLTFLAITALVSPCQADNFYYLVIAGDATGPCVTADYGFVSVIGVFEFDAPAKGVKFSAPLPPYNATLTWEEISFSFTGDLVTGIEVDFDSCLTGAAAVFYREFTIDGLTCLGGIEGFGGGGLPMVIGCDDIERELTDQPCGGAQPPVDLTPPNGSAGVVLTPTLSWTWSPPGVCFEGLGLTIFSVYLGTDPEDLPLVVWTDGDTQATVGPLQPNTLYYWYIHVFDDYWIYPGSHHAETGIHTFTTEAPIQTEQTTWGYIKNLFK